MSDPPPVGWVRCHGCHGGLSPHHNARRDSWGHTFCIACFMRKGEEFRMLDDYRKLMAERLR